MYPAANPCHHQVNPGRYLDTGSSPVKSPNLPFSRNFSNYQVGNKISNYCRYKVVCCFKYILTSLIKVSTFSSILKVEFIPSRFCPVGEWTSKVEVKVEF